MNRHGDVLKRPEAVGVDNWEVRDYVWDRQYTHFRCRQPGCDYTTWRGNAGSSRINHSMLQHLRDKHGVCL